ncbi:MAG: (deoxy)nucleoside triphosphate pyrophosphohydrolase [Oscillospiraceae bacterium]|nr:(deoxy)nucleoside triphosphate pyrophosphohydrolase [Oscillospiraceae bacterium]
MKKIPVVAAVIRREGKILATQRGYGPQKDGWEFPGGKVESGEDPREALVREIREELRVDIVPGVEIGVVEHEYPNISIRMQCFWAEIREGSPVLTEHENAKWISADELEQVDWLPADRKILPIIKEGMQNE